MNLSNLILIVWISFFSSSPVPLSQAVAYDLEASEVVCHTTDTGDRYFSYLVTNVGSETAPAGSYQVYFKVNGKMISFERVTGPLEAAKSILYTSEHKFDPNQKKRVLKYNLIINTKDSNKDNNRKSGEISL
ncbi:hypothetical protein [Lunatibacter salilacus]|uniref:hypothetical protein n=1 Tax=Lunatibacter salilacus TaxID=2483804 RepID=UPI00131AEA3E|nr:hypothetical protein [Lunatibacter salilacus]